MDKIENKICNKCGYSADYDINYNDEKDNKNRDGAFVLFLYHKCIPCKKEINYLDFVLGKVEFMTDLETIKKMFSRIELFFVVAESEKYPRYLHLFVFNEILNDAEKENIKKMNFEQIRNIYPKKHFWEFFKSGELASY